MKQAQETIVAVDTSKNYYANANNTHVYGAFEIGGDIYRLATSAKVPNLNKGNIVKVLNIITLNTTTMGNIALAYIDNGEPDYHFVLKSAITPVVNFSGADGKESKREIPVSENEVKKYILLQDYDIVLGYKHSSPQGTQGIWAGIPLKKTLLKGATFEGYLENPMASREMKVPLDRPIPFNLVTVVEGKTVRIPIRKYIGTGKETVPILQELIEPEKKETRKMDVTVTDLNKPINPIIPFAIGTIVVGGIMFIIAPKVVKKITLQNKVLLSVGVGLAGGFFTRVIYPKFQKEQKIS